MNPSLDLKKYFCFGFLRIRSNPGRQNWKELFNLKFNLVKTQCDLWNTAETVKKHLLLHIWCNWSRLDLPLLTCKVLDSQGCAIGIWIPKPWSISMLEQLPTVPLYSTGPLAKVPWHFYSLEERSAEHVNLMTKNWLSKESPNMLMHAVIKEITILEFKDMTRKYGCLWHPIWSTLGYWRK